MKNLLTNTIDQTGDILVSICCFAYNHEKFISEAIESFVNQQTSFKYEILIHDDASTDQTPKIIERYRKKYPHLIKTVLQKQNQYSKRPGSMWPFLLEKALGKYLAVCDGDDFWYHNYKLEAQTNEMELYENCSMSFHNAYFLIDGELNQDFFQVPKEKVIYQKDILRRHFIPTCSVMLSHEKLIRARNMCRHIEKFPVGDIPMYILITNFGPAINIDQYWSIYRYNVFSATNSQQHLSGIRIKMIIMYARLVKHVSPSNVPFVFFKILRQFAGLILDLIRVLLFSAPFRRYLRK